MLGDGLAERRAAAGRRPSAASNAARATPTAREAMLMRPISSTPRICGKPPARLADEVARRGCGGRRRTSPPSRRPCSRACRRACSPRCRSNAGPGSFSTMNAEMPSSVRAASATMPGPLAVRDPRLGAVDDVLVAVAHAPCTRCCGCRCRRRAPRATARRARSPVAMVGQPALLLLVGAVVHEQRGRHGVGVDDAGEAHPAVGELLDHADVGEQVEAEAAVSLRDRDAEQADARIWSTSSAGKRSSRSRVATGITSRATNRRTVLDDLLAHLGVGRRVRGVHAGTVHRGCC